MRAGKRKPATEEARKPSLEASASDVNEKRVAG